MGRRASRFLVVLLAILVSTGCSSPSDGPGWRSGSGGIPFATGGTGGLGGEGGADGGSGGAGGTGGEGGSEPQLPPIEIHAIYPAFGTVDGRTPVTITGAGFVTSVPDEAYGASTVVTFGDNPSAEIRVVDDQTILATSPVGLVGAADIKVRNKSGEAICAACFLYLPPLQLRAIEPNEASMEGGSRVVLRGEGLTEATTVLFGDRAALSPTLREDGGLEVVLPPGDEPGLVDVRIYEASRQSLLRRAFRYLTPLRVDAIEPPSSPLEGGGNALIVGEGFTPSTRVFFGDAEAVVHLQEAGLLVEIPPGVEPGPVVVEVREGESRFPFPFAYFDPEDRGLALHAVVPPVGPIEGGTEVAVLGSGFDGEGLVLYFGEQPSPSLRIESPHLLRALTPASPEGTVDVRVRTGEGLRSLPAAFRFAVPMEIQGVEPASGPTEGGTIISLHGAGFPPNPRVFVGALEATDVVRVDGGRIEARTPPGSEGVMPVRVVDADAPGERAILPGAFAYEGSLEVAVAEPATGARAGGTRVLVRGSGFRGEMKVYFGENEAESVRVLDPFTLEVFTPRANVGLVDLRVERSDGEEAKLEGGFYYFNPASNYGGSSGGPLSGVLNLTVLARSGPLRNGPIEGCTVHVGVDESTLLTKLTDDRGQATFSSPSLVKAVDLSVTCEDYEMATLVNQVSENVTILLRFTGVLPPIDPPEEEEEEGEIDIRPPPISTIVGRVFGFKPPISRPLAPNEELLAYVSVAPSNIYSAPPFSSQMPVIAIRQEGEYFAFRFWGPAYATVHAIYGIRNVDTDDFEPLLLGFVRGIAAKADETTTVDLVLDIRLDREIPVTLPEPVWYERDTIMVRAFLDLGVDGVIPLGVARNSDEVDRAVLKSMPGVSGEDLVFQAWSSRGGARPWSVTYVRQSGDPTQGVSFGTLLGPPILVEPPQTSDPEDRFEGVFEWELPPGAPLPDVISLNLYDSGTGRPLWHAVLSGDERRVRLPDALVEELRQRSSGAPLRIDILTGSQPTFDFIEWNYRWLGMGNFISFTTDQVTVRP